MQATAEIAERISNISVSSTMKVAADADKLRREGVDVVDFGAGEPDFPTPENVKRAAMDATAARISATSGRMLAPSLRTGTTTERSGAERSGAGSIAPGG